MKYLANAFYLLLASLLASPLYASEMLVTCDPANITYNSNGTVRCSAWIEHEYSLPLYELEMAEITALMGASLLFFTICYVGNSIVKQLMNHSASDK